MQLTKKIRCIAILIVIGIWTSIQISAMESREQRAEEIRLDQQRRQQQNQQPQQQKAKKKKDTKKKHLLNQLETLQKLQQMQLQSSLTKNQLREMQALQKQLDQLSPQQFKRLQKDLQKRQQQKQLNQSQYQPSPQPQQPYPSTQPLKLQQSQAPQKILATREVAMKQILLNDRDTEIQQLEKQIKSPSRKPMQLLETIDRLQIPIDLYLLEPSDDLEDKAKKIQSQSTREQQTEQNQIQQQRLEQIEQQLLLEQIELQNLKQRLFQTTEQPLLSAQPKLQQIPNDEELSILQEGMCCIEANDCTEDKGVRTIPCKNNHPELICNSCLNQIRNKTNECPMCRAPLL